jgi:hypothetical protein
VKTPQKNVRELTEQYLYIMKSMLKVVQVLRKLLKTGFTLEVNWKNN